MSYSPGFYAFFSMNECNVNELAKITKKTIFFNVSCVSSKNTLVEDLSRFTQTVSRDITHKTTFFLRMALLSISTKYVNIIVVV